MMGVIRIDIVSMKILVHSHRAHNGKEVFFQKIVKNLGIYLRDLSHKANVLSVGIFLFYC